MKPITTSILAIAFAFVFASTVVAQTLPGGQTPRGTGGCAGTFKFVDQPPYYAGESYLIDITFQGDCAGKRGDVLLWVDGLSTIVARAPLSKTWNMTRASIAIPEGGTLYGLSAYAFPGGKMAFGASGGMTLDVRPDPSQTTTTNPTPTPTPTPNTTPPGATVTPTPTPSATPTPTPTPTLATTPTPTPTRSFLSASVPGNFVAGIFNMPVGYNSLGELAVGLIRFVLAMLGTLAVLFIIIGAVRMVTSAGNEKAVTAGKQTVTWALIGLAVSLLAFGLVAGIQAILGRQ